MGRKKTAYYYMTYDERRAYFRKKQREYYERKMALYGRTVRHPDPDSHPSQMTPHELKEYNHEKYRRYRERLKSHQHDNNL